MDPQSTRSYKSFKQQKPQKKRRFLIFKQKKTNLIKTRRVVSQNILQPRPAYARQKLNKRKNYRNKIIIPLLVLLVVAWLSLMLYSSYFRLNKIVFDGLETIEKKQIEEYIKTTYLSNIIIPNQNFFICNTKKIEKGLRKKYAIDKVVVEKIFPKELKISIVEKVSTIIYDNGSSYTLLDKDGMVIKLLDFYGAITPDITTDIPTSTVSASTITNTTTSVITITSTVISEAVLDNKDKERHVPEYGKLHLQYGQRLPIVYDSSHKPIVVKQLNVLPKYFLDAILDWQVTIEKEGVGVIRYFDVSNYNAGATIYIDKKWHILIQPKNPIKQQIDNLNVLLRDSSIIPAEYINLRFGERVFWK